MLKPVIKLAIDAYQQSDRDRKLVTNPAGKLERQALPSSVSGKIFAAAILSSDSGLEFLHNDSAVLVSYVFFECGEACIFLQLR